MLHLVTPADPHMSPRTDALATSRSRIPTRIAEELRRFPPFSMLDDELVVALAKKASVQVAVKGEAVWSQGEIPPGNLLFLTRGRVEYQWHNDGQTELVDIRDVGDLLGLTALVEGMAYQVSAIAAEDCLLYAIPWNSMSHMLDAHDDARNYIHRHLFWLTRVGGSVSSVASTGVDAPGGVAGRAKGILQAHLDSAQLVVSRAHGRLKTCDPRDSVAEVAGRMSRQDLDSIIVIDANRHPVGIVTATDLVSHIIVGGASPLIAVESVMSGPVITVAENSSAIAATLVMMKHKISHVCVTTDGSANSPTLDVWSDRELMARSGHHPAGLLREFSRAKTIARARELSDEIEQLAANYLNAGVTPTLVGQICAELFDQLTQRLLTLAKNEWVGRGDSLPPVAWAWMSVGSDGRREQILRTDMDNALVFAASGEPQTDEQHRSAFTRFAHRVIDMMVECGISRCQGGVMACNPKWCRTTDEWQQEIDNRELVPSGESMLRTLTLYDLRYVAGDPSLVEPLRDFIYQKVPRKPAIMQKLAELVVAKPPPLNFLGRFVVEKKGGREVEFDLKARGLAPLRDAARLLSLKHGLKQHYSTGSRWEQLATRVPEFAEIAPLALESHDELMRIRVLNGIKRRDSGRFLDPATLTKLDRTRLANVFSVLRMVQMRIRNEFQIDPRTR